MRSRISLGVMMMLAALLISFVPAATITTAVAAQPAALPSCDWAQFIADVTVPDGSTFAPGAAFTKTWRLRNVGTCTWSTSYSLVFDSGNNMGGPSSVNFPNSVAPGQTVDISIGLTAPSSAGHYIGYWKFRNASGDLFGIGSNGSTSWWVDINVSGSSSGGTAYDFAANYCSASWFSVQGSLPCPGTDGDSRGFVLKVVNPQLENGAFDTGAGLITEPQNGFNGDIHGVFPPFHVQPGDKFQSIVNCAYGATSCYVTFRLDYQIGSGPINTYWTWREKYEGLYFRANVDLTPLAGQDVSFILTVLANGSGAGDRALWSNPIIARVGTTPPPPPSTGSNFDFGTATSPVASGYQKVTEATTYTSGGFGWTNTTTLESRDRGAPANDLKRDFVLDSSAARTFKADMPNGTYAVTVTMGDNGYAHDNMVVKANGTTVLPDVDTALGAFAVNTFNVTVTTGSLSLEFSDAGGTDPTWVVNAVAISPTSPPPPPPAGANFDFGTATSPVASGYLKVTEATAYTSGGFGWTDNTTLESRDRTAPADDMKRDFVMDSSAARTFKADLPNGTYAVTVTMGDNGYAHDNMLVKANGTTVLPDVDTAMGAFAVNTFNVTVTTGSLSLQFSDAGGTDPTWVVNGVAISPTSSPPSAGSNFDFGTATSPVASGYQKVTEATAYTSGGFGWTNTTTLESRDRTAPADALKRDFVLDSSAARTFKADMPNGTYAVTVTMGDNGYAHDNMVVKANGTTVLPDVDTALGAFAVNTFNATVTTGSLSLEFSDAGGTDPTWVVNAVAISPSSTPPPPPPPTSCDRAQFIADITVPDGTRFNPGETFTKVWRLKNVGTCTWTTSYLMVFDSGDKMGGPDSVNLPQSVAPGQTVDLSLNLTAPTSGGHYRGYWKFQNAGGTRFGLGANGTSSWWVDIVVWGPFATPGSGDTPVPGPTPVSGTMQYDFAANACSAVWLSAVVQLPNQLPCPGTDGDPNGFVLQVSNPQLETGAVSSGLGLITFPQNTWNGYIQGFYPSYTVQSGDRFRSIVNCAYGATSCNVVFRLDFQTGSGPITTFWAFLEKYDGQYYQADLSLSPLVGQNVKFILTVLSAGSPNGDRALWVAPMIYHP